MRSVELFAGAGGLALGLARAGFEHSAVLEWDRHAAATLRKNRRITEHHRQPWPVIEGDVTKFPFDSIDSEPDLISGGVPCQPFSLGGKHRGRHDERNMFPAFIEVVRRLQPKAIIIENVKGLLRPTFRPYFDYILRALTFPEISNPGADWQEHDNRLVTAASRGGAMGLKYEIKAKLLNAADYGIPQHRERVFIVGLRSDLDVHWDFPRATHSRSALDFDKATGDYWRRHGIAPPKEIPQAPLVLVPHTLPWVTVRDVISDLPQFGSADADAMQHVFQNGARQYAGHTGSDLDAPAKTLKAGVHGVPGGENMLVADDGSVRYFSVREAARLQTFPDPYVFCGSWSEMMRQIGNAVPVELAEMLGTLIAGCLEPSRSNFAHVASSVEVSLHA